MRPVDHDELRRLTGELQEAASVYDMLGSLYSLHEAVAAFNRLVENGGFAEAHANFRSDILLMGAKLFLLQGKYEGDPAALDRSLATWQEAASAAPDAKRSQEAEFLIQLAHEFLRVYGDMGTAAALEQSIVVGRLALAAAEDAELGRNALKHLADSFRELHTRTGSPADLDTAIAYCEQCLDGDTTAATLNSAACLNSLAICLDIRWSERGAPADLDRAIELYGLAIEAVGPDSPNLPSMLNNLGVSFLNRYYRDGSFEDLEQAIKTLADALEKTAEGSPDLPARLDNLANFVWERYAVTDSLDDLRRVLELREQAIAALNPRSPALPRYESNLGNVQDAWYEQTGEVEFLDRAIEHHERAIAISSEASVDLPRFLNSLSGSLKNRFENTHDAADLDGAIEKAERSVALAPSTTYERWTFVAGLAARLRDRYELSGRADDREGAITLYRAAGHEGLEANPRVALRAGIAWGDWAMERGSWAEAAEAYADAIDAAERVFRAQLTRAHKEVGLRNAQGLPARAAYALASTGDIEAAAVALERGRAVLLSESLERDRTDLVRLAELGHAELVDRYRQTADRVDLLERQTLEPEPGQAAEASDALRAARDELEAAITAVRRVEGYGQFLEPPTIDDVRRHEVPIVYIEASLPGGLALVVREVTTAIWLEQLTSERLREKTKSFLDAYGLRQSAPETWLETLDATTAWLWDAVMGPVLAALGPIPRVTLVPGGLLGVLPLHAAWCEDDARRSGRRYALDELVMAYAPNARTLSAAERLAAETSVDGLLAVEEPRPVTAPPLAAASSEVDAAVAAISRACRLRHEEATREAVLAGLAAYPVLHFACHGSAALTEPLDSSLLMAGDEKLTIRDLFAHGAARARLAVLSACETALSGVGLPDEVVSLPSALLQVGVGGVVGSFWSVPDASTTALMACFYELWRQEGLEPADALVQAQRWVRDSSNGEKHDRFPTIEALAGRRVPERARTLWREAHGYRAPHYWAAFAYVGA